MGFFFFGVFFVFGDNIGNFFYKNQNVGPMMVALSWCCILMYFQQIVVGIMNGLGKQGKSLINSMVGYGIRLGFIWFAIPKYGVQGYLWGSIASMVVVSAMDMAVIIKATGMLFDVRRWLIWPGICGVAIMMSGIILQKMSFFSGEGLKWIFAMGISCILGAGMLILTGSVRFKNLKDLL
jgi:stage V sporulation protein B